MYKNLYSQITDALVNDGYIVIENALDKKLSQELSVLAKNITEYKRAGVSTTASVDVSRRRDKIFWIDADSDPTAKYLAFADGLKEYLNRNLYLGLKYYEAHLARYEEGDFYEKHLDAFKNSKNRIVTIVYYLNEDWQADNGGELIIYDEKDVRLNAVIPHTNTLVIFMSENFPHEVLKAKQERYSIAGWFRIDRY